MTPSSLVTCPDCAAVQSLGETTHPRGAVCFRCGAVLAGGGRSRWRGGAAALTIAALPVLVAANCLPVMRVDAPGQTVTATVLDGVRALHLQNRDALAVLVVLLAGVLPAIWMGAVGYLGRRRRAPAVADGLSRLVDALGPWSQIEILLLGMLVALARMAHDVRVVPGAALPCMAAFLLLAHLARRSLGPRSLSQVRPHRPGSLGRTTAFLLGAVVLLVPANLLAITTTNTLLGARTDTLASGVRGLWSSGSQLLALLVLTASIVVPVVKVVALALLVISSRRRATWWRVGRTRLYRLVHRLGRWSMLDVFVMALLATVLRTRVAAVTIEAGAVAFAGAVVLTMLSSASFDPRLLWQAGERS